MADSLATQAHAAMVDEEWDLALDLYSQAITASPQDAGLLTARAQAHLKLENWLEAADDATRAVNLDPSLSKAHFRKGVASFELEEFEAAKAAFEEAQRLDPKNKQAATWLSKCDAALEGESAPMAVDEQQQPTAQDDTGPPTAALAAATPAPPVQAPPTEVATNGDGGKSGEASGSAAPVTPPVAEAVRPVKYRHQWLQTPTHVEVAVLAKKLTSERVSVTIEEGKLSVIIRDETGQQEYDLTTQLYGPIVTAESRWELLSTKVEVRMKKATSGQAWPTLEPSGAVAAANWSLPTQAPARVYPSSRKQVVDWDKLEAEVKDEEKNEQLDGDAGVNRLFQQIYAGADEDTRRAMNKSFQESNGTVLSTNWKDIGSKKTEYKPPEGADEKRYEL